MGRTSQRERRARNFPNFIDDRAAITPSYLRARCRRLHRQAPLSLIVIDYLQLMTPETGPKASRAEAVGSLSRALKSLSKELRVPILCLAQLNRAVDGRTDRRPQLSDLRDSGEIEQDADAVSFLSRRDEATDCPLIDFSLRKNRNGPVGDALLTFHGPTVTFSAYDGPMPTETPKPRRGFAL